MKPLSLDTARAILARAYPELLQEADPDIERYFDLRSSGRSQEALALYASRLAAKYPDSERRVLLLRLYRRRDPRFMPFQRECAIQLAEILAERIRRNIRFLSEPLDGVDEKDAFRLIKAVEEVVRLLPPDKYEAAGALDGYRSYAALLDYRAQAMARTADIAKEYILESAQEDEGLGEIDFVERSRAIEEERRKRRKSQYFDLSRIQFSPSDLSRILLPSHLTRKEDKVLGYCYRYWNLVMDQAFERTILLYSRKYGTRHYDIYRSIKIGRRRKFTDDEILNTVSTIMSSAYSYSVQGDLYMQAMWKRLKSSLEQGGLRPAFAPAPSATAASAAVTAEEPTTEQAEPKAPAPRAARARTAKRKAPPPSTKKSVAGPAKDEKGKPQKRARPVHHPPAPRSALAPSPPPAPAKPAPPALSRATKASPLAPKPEAPSAAQVSSPIRGESVSDIIKRLSGRTWDVYRDAFMDKVGSSIRSQLTENRTHHRLVFDTSLNAAEEIVLRFITEHYDDPYMDWAGSQERRRVEDLGYAVPSLEPIIEDCYRRL